MASFIKTDLEFILDQIRIAEEHAAGADLRSLLPNTEVPFGLRTLDGSFNNVVPGRSEFGAADNLFPRMLAAVFRNDQDGDSIDLNGPAPGGVLTNTDYAVAGDVVDADPRTISNLIVDQTEGNEAANAAAAATPGSELVTGTRADGTPFTTWFIPNVAPDEGLSAPFNSWMTFFGQFFDHGLDLVSKGGNGTVFIPLQADDPLVLGPDGIAGTADDLPAAQRFMVLTRATNQPGPDGLLGTADDVHEHANTTSPFVDQNQTYSSHPSHQVFLRAYEINANGDPVSTGKLIENPGTGGMATWAAVKAQARDLLGINLTDADVFNVPLLATDQYGAFLRGPNGLPQVVMKTAGDDGIIGTPDDGTELVEGNLAAPISLTNAVRTGHAFLDDIAHNASPRNAQTGAPLNPDSDSAVGLSEPGTYDNELLDAHYIAGDGRVNENIGLTTVHHVFHSEHNRLVEHTKSVLLESGDVDFLNQWLLTPVAAIPADPSTLVWNGERLFQAAKFGTEMQYQHLVFEEFARTIQPNVDAFLDFDDTVDASIVAEFAHTVYRFGHSMLTETIDRLDPNFANSEIGLIQAFLNPLEFAASGATPDEAAGAIVRGLTRQVGNEIDEFVTEALRNNLLGLPLDLPAINLARGRDAGIPSLNAARRTFFEGTGDSQLAPYTSWFDFVQHIKHPESLVNFIAAYGTHDSITGATTLAEKRAAAMELVFGTDQNGDGIVAADRLDFLHGTNAWASGADGVTITGLDDVDFWIGGLAEAKMPFGGMLGSSFNFVFETQLEALQNGDRLYYLHRLAGRDFLLELENNSFSKLVMLNTDATHLPALIFTTPGLILEVDPTLQFNAAVANDPGPDGILFDDPLTPADESADNIATPTQDPLGDSALIPLVIRDNPATAGADTNYLQYTGDEHVVLGGTAGNDILVASEGDDTLWGDGGNDRLEGGYGNDTFEAGDGHDILTDAGGDDVLKGGSGNDVIHAGPNTGVGDLVIAGPGKDFIISGEDFTETFAGGGDDFIRGGRLDAFPNGNEGNDWIEGGTQDGAAGDNFDPLALDSVVGHDVFLGDGGFDEMLGEGGDDIAVGSEGPDKYKLASGFDWVTFKDDRFGVNADYFSDAFNDAPLPASLAAVDARFAQVEGLSGSSHSDILRGDNADAAQIATAGFTGSVLTNVSLINGLQAFLGAGVTSFGAGNIILGGDGSDIIEGRGGDDLIDGDRWLNVRISVRQGIDANGNATGPEIETHDSMDPLIPRMLSGEINPGQLVIVREILNAGPNFDTAVFSDLRANYTVSTVAGVTTVTHNDPNAVNGIGIDGVDRLTNIERLQFNDLSLTLSGTNNNPVGLVAVSDTTPAVGQVLTASIAGVTDADNPGPITGPVSYVWQVDLLGTGVFQDINGAAGGAPIAVEPSLTVTPDLVGLALRVKAHYQDANGVLETVFSAPTAAVEAGTPAPGPAPLLNGPQTGVVSAGVHFLGSDLQFILDQIKVAEAHAGGADPTTLIPNARMALGLRTVDGSFNNLVRDQNGFGAADEIFPRMTTPDFRDAEAGTSYTQNSGLVVDSQPRTISNLIVDQTANNPAAVAAAEQTDGAGLVDGTRADGTPFQTFFIPNVAPDVGLSAPFNAWMTFFGQFFDHGLDLVTKGGSGTVFVPLQEDDPLFVPGSPTNFMVLTRATNQPGPDGVLGTGDDIHEHTNTTSPFIDQNQTYASHPAHQVFLRAYELNPAGEPVATGKLIVNRDLGADGRFGGTDADADTVLGGMATWAVVKAQARDLLGIQLTDADVFNIPLLATDAYGNFLRGPNGLPQVVMKTAGDDGIIGTPDDGTELVEGNLAAPISLANAVRTGHAFLDDIAHNAVPVFNAGVLVPDADPDAGNAVAVGPGGQNLEYDNELLDAHYIAGDGRVNENIGLTTVHHVFHAEHNRLVEHTKDVVLDTAAGGDMTFLNEWLLQPVTAVPADLSTLVWNGERLFQAAKFGTEMQYQHLVFEEFARTIQPNIDVFIPGMQNYQTEINPAIVAEFAHTVYRFGHSMLTETIDRLDPNFQSSEIGLIQAFLNPLAFAESGPTPDAAAGAIIRGVTRQVGNEIDEFVTEALRNNLLGLPLDLAAINLARGRDTGIPSLNAARAEFYNTSGDSNLKPYTSWGDFVQHLKHPESLVNFIAAYGTHSSITSETTLAGKRAAANLLVFGDQTVDPDGIPGNGDETVITAPADRIDFLMSSGTWTGIETGLNNVDLWIGGLAEKTTPFGGMLGSTFNFVFEDQMEKLQNADRFYYLERTAGMNFLTELESNSFAKLVMANTDATHLPGLIFQTNLILEADQSRQFNETVIPGPDGILGTADDLPGNTDPTGDNPLVPLVMRDNPTTPGIDPNYLKYTGDDHVVLGGTEANDTLIASIGDDTLYGDGGNDRLEGGHGNDFFRGGAGDDIITDIGGDDVIQGDDGNDVIHGGNGVNLVIAGFGNDFVITGEDASEAFGGPGNDFILGNNGNEQDMGNEGDDWLEGGLLDGSPGDNFDPLGRDLIIGNDVYLGSGLADIMNAEGGDDIMIGSSGPGDKYLGASGFDWATFKDDQFGVSIDMAVRAFDVAPVPVAQGIVARFAAMEGLSGSSHSDYLRGDDADALTIPNAGAQGSVLTNIGLIDGLQEFLGVGVTSFGSGNIILGGDGSDLIEGRGGDDLIDGDQWLNVQIAVTGHPTITRVNSMTELVPYMLSGEINPGQLSIVREIMPGNGEFNFDTAVFSDLLVNYAIDFGLNGEVTVTHLADGVPGGPDGVDRLTNIERLQFNDATLVLAGGNADPDGLLALSDPTPEVGQPITVSIGNVTDADNTDSFGAIPGPVTYMWQADLGGTGVFEDLTIATGVGIETVTGPSFTPTADLVGLSLRVRAVYQDQHGVLETVFSAPTAAVTTVIANDAPVLVNDIFATPEDTALTVNVLANDLDAEGDALTIVNVTSGTGGTAVLNGDGTVTFTPDGNFNGPASFTYTASDGLHAPSGPATATVNVVAANDPAAGAPAISDTTPTEGQALTATPGTITDTDGTTTSVFTYQWQSGNGAVFTDIAGATDATFTPTQAQVNQQLRVVASFTDDQGTAEVRVSAATTVVGDLVIGTDAAETIDGTAGEDDLRGNGGNDTLRGLAGNDLLAGGTGNDVLNGGGGGDSMTGGAGNDTYIVQDAADQVSEDAAAGIDTVQSTLSSYTLGNNVENLRILATGAANGTGNALNNVLTAGAGDNVLDGGDGIDTVSYATAALAVAVSLATGVAAGGSGNDTLLNVENLVGSSSDDSLAGNTIANNLNGGGGNDTLSGLQGNDTLIGGAGNDTLDGGAGVDMLSGGAGDDTYHVDSLSDVVAEAADAGTDTVISTANSHTLRANVENLSFAGIGNFAGTGNGLANTITGGDGNDALNGGSGNDTLNGGAGNDMLNGGTGADSMAGGLGNDIYFVDDSLDVVSENAGAGTDTVQTTLASRTLEAEVENLVFTGAGNFSGTGNELGNLLAGGVGNDTLNGLGGNDSLAGGAGNDTLDGGAGVDRLNGGAGDDTYHVDSPSDAVTEAAGAGTDTVLSTANTYTLSQNVENLAFTGVGSFVGVGNTLANGITGGAGDDTLVGGGGNDSLDGGAGNDSLNAGQGDDRVTGGAGDDFMVGGLGADVFVFAAGFGSDTIQGFDFNPVDGQDLLDVSAFGITDFANQVSITDLGTDTLITIEADSILLLGIANPAVQIDQSDFLLA